jgi:hypothetical protein
MMQHYALSVWVQNQLPQLRVLVLVRILPLERVRVLRATMVPCVHPVHRYLLLPRLPLLLVRIFIFFFLFSF